MLEFLVISNGSIFVIRFSDILDNLGISYKVCDFWRVDRVINKYKDVEGFYLFVDRFDFGVLLFFMKISWLFFFMVWNFLLSFWDLGRRDKNLILICYRCW